MTKEEVFDFFDEHWSDYNEMLNLLQKLFEHHEQEIESLKKMYVDAPTSANAEDEIKALKELLQQCQDELDEERHK